MNNKTVKPILIIAVMLAAASTRLFPHVLNFTPITAIALFGAALLPNNWMKFTLPLAVIFLSDCLLQLQNGTGFYQGMGVVYFAYSIMLVWGMYMTKKLTFPTVLFFLITNFALFYSDSAVLNPALAGITNPLARVMASYTAAIPFFRNSLTGDLLFSGILFGGYFAVTKIVKSFKLA